MLAVGAGLSCSTGALRLLMRTKWPGNVAQLREVLRYTGVIEPGDRPRPHRRTATNAKRQERMSRATIYHKIREYGIDIPQ